MKRKYFVLNTVTVLTLATAMNTSSSYANSTETSASVAPTTNTIVQTNDSILPQNLHQNQDNL